MTNMLSLGVFVFVFLGLRGALWSQMCGTVHLDTKKGGGHDIDIPWEILGQDDSLLCYSSTDKGRYV